ncbi:hypothetical protein LLH00_13150 [bacterium]|nr:hypothetical protein [bacterium]
MDAEELVLLIIKENEGCVRGKTLLQKKAYFVNELLQTQFDYKPHYYGPYSTEIEGAVSNLKALGLLQENAVGFGLNGEGFEIRRYDYILTGDGEKIVNLIKGNLVEESEKISKAIECLKSAGDNDDYFKLSIAAKTHFILTKRGIDIQKEGKDGIVKAAHNLGWDIKPELVDNAVEFLSKLYSLNK